MLLFGSIPFPKVVTFIPNHLHLECKFLTYEIQRHKLKTVKFSHFYP